MRQCRIISTIYSNRMGACADTATQLRNCALNSGFGSSAYQTKPSSVGYASKTRVLSLMADTDDVMAHRYLRGGYFTRPAHEALDRTCVSFHHSVGGSLQGLGIPVRL